MQNYAKIGDIDYTQYSLHNIFIISKITLLLNPSTNKLVILVFNSSCKIVTFH